MKKTFYKGSILVYALGVVSFVSILLLGLVQMIASQAKFGYDAVEREKAFQVVESCSQEYRWYLAHNTDGYTIEEVADFWERLDPLPWGLEADGRQWQIKNSMEVPFGECKAKIMNAPITTSKPVIVNFEGNTLRNPSIKKQIQVRFRRTSWSDYVVLSNEYASFDSKWKIKGRIMSNTGVKFDGVAYGRVYAGSESYEDSDGVSHLGVWSSQDLGISPNPPCEFNLTEGSCVFLGGKRFPVPKKDFEGIVVDLSAMRTAAKKPDGNTIDGCNYGGTNNCYFSNSGKVGKYITLKNDNTFDIITVKDYNSTSFAIKNTMGTASNFNIPDDGIIFVDDNVWIAGTLNDRRITIVAGGNGTSEGNIYVGMGDLKYTNKDGRDVLGLIANGSIAYTLDKKICNGTCVSDLNLEIDAAMIAKDGEIGRPGFNENCCGGGCALKKNRIDIYGSIVSNAFIQFADSKDCPGKGIKDVGFDIKKIEYDNNLYLNPPPFFPTDVYYTADLWNEL
ncbi:MAG: hypothetical protein ACD_56C00165G0005 [uncultured bacterium]|nr:MAG: hypothetical protein ACD_56C00165G0005 [uncultured bacterium]